MAKNITIMGASYSDVPAVQLPQTGGGTARFDDCTVTTATASDVAQGKVFVASDGTITTGTASGGGGSSGLTLIQTTSLGALSTTSTSATDTGKTITLASATNFDSYDLLIVDISVDTQTNGRHTSTVSQILLTGTSDVNTKTSNSVIGNKWNSKLSSTGIASTRNTTSSYGVYINTTTLSNRTLTMTVYYRYSSTYTGTLDGTYTARIYGIKLMDLIGG